MANPRQRRKIRSSSYRPVSHSRHAKRNLKKTPPIRGPKVLQEAWDKKKTVRQNYAKLGLASSLDPSASGGVEKLLGKVSDVSQEESTLIPPSSDPPIQKSEVPSGYGRIIRDEDGQAIGVELNDDEHDAQMELEDDDVDHVHSRIDPEVRRRWVSDFTTSTSSLGAADDSVVKELEQISASATGSTTLALPLSGIGSRHASTGEVKYLQPLVTKHGTNIDAMARDLRLNPEQRTIGQLKRALRKAGLLNPDS